MRRSFKTMLLLSGMLLPAASSVFAQNTAPAKPALTRKKPKQVLYSKGWFLGIGSGLDYGGLGLKVEATPTPYLGIFLGLGYNLQSAGINGGLSLKPLPHAKFAPVIQAMYGYNAVIVVKNMESYNKTYYGPSFGVGFDWYMGRADNKLFFGLYAPIRSDAFHRDYDALKSNPNITMGNISDVTLSIGFNWRIH